MKKVLGMGNALVDVLVSINDDQLLDRFELPKGSMQLVDKEKSRGTNLVPVFDFFFVDLAAGRIQSGATQMADRRGAGSCENVRGGRPCRRVADHRFADGWDVLLRSRAG